MNVIIIAAIALIVLVVLIAIFTGRMGVFSRDLESSTKKQSCSGDFEQRPVSQNCEIAIGNFEVGPNMKCCVKS